MEKVDSKNENIGSLSNKLKADRLIAVLTEMDESSLIRLLESSFQSYDYPMLSMKITEIKTDEDCNVLFVYRAIIYPYQNRDDIWDTNFSTLWDDNNTCIILIDNVEDAMTITDCQLSGDYEDPIDVSVDDEIITNDEREKWREIVKEILEDDVEEFLETLPGNCSQELVRLCKEMTSAE